MKQFWVLPPVLALCVSLAQSASAEIWSAGGLTFSDERGGFRLISVTGSGSLLDPIVIVEEMIDIGEVVLVIRGAEKPSAEGTMIRPPSFLSIAVTKIVLNRSGQAWAGFDMELREALDTPSPYGDGLSFDQLRTFDQPLTSDSFPAWRRMDEPYDRVRFYGAYVDPGATARFGFYVTDPTPTRVFYLLQQPQYLIARPSTGTELLALGPERRYPPQPVVPRTFKAAGLSIRRRSNGK
jgi:hypothetical protein